MKMKNKKRILHAVMVVCMAAIAVLLAMEVLFIDSSIWRIPLACFFLIILSACMDKARKVEEKTDKFRRGFIKISERE